MDVEGTAPTVVPYSSLGNRSYVYELDDDVSSKEEHALADYGQKTIEDGLYKYQSKAKQTTPAEIAFSSSIGGEVTPIENDHMSVGSFLKSYYSKNTRHVPRCAKCGKKRSNSINLFVCSLCRRTYYCSRECQSQHWKNHRVPCFQVQNQGY